MRAPTPRPPNARLGLATLCAALALACRAQPGTTPAPSNETAASAVPSSHPPGATVSGPQVATGRSPLETCPLEAAAAPLALPTPPPPANACRHPSSAFANELRVEAKRRWRPHIEGATVTVSFACDRLGPHVGDLIFESSTGHGFGMGLHRLHRRHDGDYDLTTLSIARARSRGDARPTDAWGEASDSIGRASAAVVPQSRVMPTLRRMRAAMHLRLVVHEPANDAGLFRMGGGSTHDFHVGYRITNAEGMGHADFWAGYEGIQEQLVWIPLAIMDDALRDLIYADDVQSRLVARAATPADKAFFAERFATARDRDPAYGYWYVKERLLGMARTLGGPELATDVLSLAGQRGDSSVARSRALAVDLLGGWAGVETRYDASGAPRPVDTVAQEWVRACDDLLPSAPSSP